MNNFLKYVFLFFLGSSFGWLLELFYRRFKHKKWVNPGMLIGPYLPIYGFGVCIMTLIMDVFGSLNPIISIILIGILMTLIELIGGLWLLKDNIKLWDYSDRWLNYKGVICPLFSFIWTLLGCLYYFVISSYITDSLLWFSNNLSFSFILGIFFCLIIMDYIYSNKLLTKLKLYAQENDIDVKIEELKKTIKEIKENQHEKYAFLNGIHKENNLQEYLKKYKRERNRRR